MQLNWNLDMLFFEERGNQRRRKQSKEPIAKLISNPGHIGGRQML